MMLPLLEHGDVRPEPLAAGHHEALKAACAEDQAIWEIYSISLIGDGFERFWRSSFDGSRGWHMWAIMLQDGLVGCSGFTLEVQTPGVAEIGTSYLSPAVRGTHVNRTAKWLMLRFLFASGFHRVEFRVDARNARSQAAVLKLGAKRDGILRRHKRTHTGHIRDTHVFGITDQDWPEIEAGLRP